MIDSGDTAWMLTSSALVLFMTPGLAFFYGGMVRAKNVLGMLMQNFFCMGLVSVLWAAVAFSLASGDGGKFIGNFDFAGLAKIAKARARRIKGSPESGSGRPGQPARASSSKAASALPP